MYFHSKYTTILYKYRTCSMLPQQVYTHCTCREHRRRTRTSALHSMSTETMSILERAGSRGNSIIWRPREVRPPVSSRAPSTHSWNMELRMLSCQEEEGRRRRGGRGRGRGGRKRGRGRKVRKYLKWAYKKYIYMYNIHTCTVYTCIFYWS